MPTLTQAHAVICYIVAASTLIGDHIEAKIKAEEAVNSQEGQQNVNVLSLAELNAIKRKGINGRKSILKSPMQVLLNSSGNVLLEQFQYSETFETKIVAARSWYSHSFSLYPGRYFLIADIEMSEPHQRQDLKLEQQDQLDERPWAEMNDEEDSDIDESSHDQSNTGSASLGKTSKKKFKPRRGNKRIWLQASSTGNFEIASFNANDCDERDKEELRHITFSSMLKDTPSDLWPFMAESQEEVASRSLMNTMSRIRFDAVNLEAFMNTQAKSMKSGNFSE